MSNTERNKALITELWEAIGHHSAQIAEADEMAPGRKLLEAVKAVEDALAASPVAQPQDERETLDDQVLRERDEAQSIADTLTSLILDEDIDWPFHDAKWREAIEAATDMRIEINDLKARATPAQDKQDTAGNDGDQDVPYLIYYDDRDRPTEVIIGSDVAHARFTRISGQWNAHLFVKVKSNSRDDPYFASNAGSQDKQGAVDAEVAGGLMASTLSDFAQMAGYALDRDDCALFDKLRKQWDAAMQAQGERG